MRIILTGSTSTIGKRLENFLKERGHIVIPLGGRDSKVWKLGEQFPSNFDADVLIHLAHDRRNGLQENLESTRIILENFSGYSLLLSSLSAHIRAKSIYGQSKFYSEELFLAYGGGAIRAGVIIDDMPIGIHQVILGAINKWPIVPTPYGGRSRFFFTKLDPLFLEILYMIESKRNAVVFGADPWPVTLDKMLRVLSESDVTGKRLKFFRINSFTTNFVLFLMKPFRKKFPSIDSLFSLKSEISNSDISKLDIPISDFSYKR